MKLRVGGMVTVLASFVVAACGTAAQSSEAEFAKGAAAILTDAEHDYPLSALVHLACTIFARGGNDVLDVTMTAGGDGHVVATEPGGASAFSQMTIAAGKEYLYEASGVAAFSASAVTGDGLLGPWCCR